MSDCFLCRMMRSFGVSGLGALIGAGAASFAGLPRGEVAWWATGGGLVLFVLVQQASLRKRRR